LLQKTQRATGIANATTPKNRIPPLGNDNCDDLENVWFRTIAVLAPGSLFSRLDSGRFWQLSAAASKGARTKIPVLFHGKPQRPRLLAAPTRHPPGGGPCVISGPQHELQSLFTQATASRLWWTPLLGNEICSFGWAGLEMCTPVSRPFPARKSSGTRFVSVVCWRCPPTASLFPAPAWVVLHLLGWLARRPVSRTKVMSRQQKGQHSTVRMSRTHAELSPKVRYPRLMICGIFGRVNENPTHIAERF